MCYTCTHCNQCGMYSTTAVVVCKKCQTHIPIGRADCPNCGSHEFDTLMTPADEAPDRSRGDRRENAD